MMEQLEEQLNSLGITFDRDGNRIRCFPHVINLAVGAALEALLHPPEPFPQPKPSLHPNTPIPRADSEDSHRLESEYRSEYQEALESDLITRVCSFVTVVRSSGQRQEKFISIIEAGNKDGGFGHSAQKLRVVGLLKDMKIRWSSLFKMIDRFLELYPDDWDFMGHEFSSTDIEVLEIVSGQKTPTLSMVLPLYEELVILLTGFSKRKPQLAHAVEKAISKLNEYLDAARKTKMYSLAIGM
ncbi:hypothetical protein CPB83DRAFT_945550 [Crepidotus variabilis]|uniref:Uncharacterized protein n=1 Tax=Crepidotus variabilis TaxID=179855 RepID=A0A9P6EPJ8_9AGAR|nr:hypothetical protein CPB83DRAFT_945550 [Crepidotus variabilis]